MIKSILTQTKIMLNKKGFMFGFSAMMMICLFFFDTYRQGSQHGYSVVCLLR